MKKLVLLMMISTILSLYSSAHAEGGGSSTGNGGDNDLLTCLTDFRSNLYGEEVSPELGLCGLSPEATICVTDNDQFNIYIPSAMSTCARDHFELEQRLYIQF